MVQPMSVQTHPLLLQMLAIFDNQLMAVNEIANCSQCDGWATEGRYRSLIRA